MATKTKSAETLDIKAKAAKALEIAREAAATAETRARLWNTLYGAGGQFGRLFSTEQEREAFAQTAESRQIDKLLDKLQHKGPPPDRQARFVLRLPHSMFEALKAEAEAEGVSINQLCLAKLATKLRQNLFVRC